MNQPNLIHYQISTALCNCANIPKISRIGIETPDVDYRPTEFRLMLRDYSSLYFKIIQPRHISDY